jgi:ubiquinone/menaquinone biosynthesis C-methylase UbiE
MAQKTSKQIHKMDSGTVIKIDLSPGIPQQGFISLYPKPLNPLEVALFLEEKRLPAKNSSVTLLVASQTLEHIEPRKFFGVMDELWRVLKVGGQLLISVPYGASIGWLADSHHINHLTAQTWYFFDPNHPTGLYTTYRPKPWKIEKCFFQSDGIMETLLIKLPK